MATTANSVSARPEGQPESLSRPYRVLHVVHHSLPVLTGYAIRTSTLVQAQRRLGFDTEVLTAPAHELRDPESADMLIADIPHWRTPLRGFVGELCARGRPVLREAAMILALQRRIAQMLDSMHFDLVHAHTPALCGLASWRAARARGLPFVYEIRGFWEESAVAQGRSTPSSLRYRTTRELETLVARRAGAVVGIAQNILEEMRSRGIPDNKLFHVPNGVDAQKFEPLSRDPELASQFGIRSDEVVLGFIGSMWRFEGISWLVRAVHHLRQRIPKLRLLLVGHGEEAEAVRQCIRELNAPDYVLFPGAVDHAQVRRYYSLMDILVYPRLRFPVTERVTPLKPLEAMAMGKAVLASNLPALRELLDDGHTGLLFEPADEDSFCEVCSRLVQDAGLRRSLGERARQKSARELDWQIVAQRYYAVYCSAANPDKTVPSRPNKRETRNNLAAG